MDLQQIQFTNEVSEVVQHVIDRAGQPEQVLPVDRRHQGPGEPADELGARFLALMLDIDHLPSCFVPRQAAADRIAGDDRALYGRVELPR